VSDTPIIVPPKLEDPWGSLLHLECAVSTELKVPDLTVDDVLRLQPGTVLSTQWRTNRDIPLRVNGRLLGFTEFDSAGETMGVRITEFTWEQQR
jgi:flagellar motor switch/type III secretory pathway protein FliN